MTPIKRLASQTAIYGLSTVFARFLNYLLIPLYTHAFTSIQYGVVSELYADSSFISVLLIFGFETAFLRFYQNTENKEKVYATSILFITAINLFFLLILFVFITPIAKAMDYSRHYEYFYWFALILVFDSISQIPFARMRSENNALSFAGIKTAEVIMTVLLNIFFLVSCKNAYDSNTGSWLARLYDPSIGPGYVFISNLIASSLKFIFLLPMLKPILSGADLHILKRMIRYSLPLVIIGSAAVINELLDRAILKFMLPYDTRTNLSQLGIYSACYKLSLVMTLFIQSFRYAAEPFFLSFVSSQKPDEIFAAVMKYFIIIASFIFLIVVLYLDYFKLFIGSDFRSGIGIVPILLMANLWLGMYINLSVWYKLTDHTLIGALIAILGALLTIILNVLFIPQYGYWASAWATLASYCSMSLLSYWYSRKYFPINYDLKSLFKYLSLILILFFAYDWVKNSFVISQIPPFVVSSSFLVLFLIYMWIADGRQLLRVSRGNID